jgi:predicted nucleotidyltransferase
MEDSIRQTLLSDPRIDVALLFGSHVTGKTTPMSDVDIGILTNVELSLMDLGSLINELESALHATVDLIELNELYKKNPQFAFNIVSNHRVVFCRQNEVLVAFKRNTFLYYFDTQPLRDMVNASFQRRIAEGKFGQKNYVG